MGKESRIVQFEVINGHRLIALREDGSFAQARLECARVGDESEQAYWDIRNLIWRPM